MEAYPEYEWLPWKFDQCPDGFWNDIKNVRKYMDWAGKELGVKEMSDWYNISRLVKNNSLPLSLIFIGIEQTKRSLFATIKTFFYSIVERGLSRVQLVTMEIQIFLF